MIEKAFFQLVSGKVLPKVSSHLIIVVVFVKESWALYILKIKEIPFNRVAGF